MSRVSCDEPGASVIESISSMSLRIEQMSNSIQLFPVYVALQKSYFNVQSVTLDPPAPIMTGGCGAQAPLIDQLADNTVNQCHVQAGTTAIPHKDIVVSSTMQRAPGGTTNSP